MEPLRLEAEHFLGYSHLDLDLSHHRALAIVGENGVGKSSLIDAMLWALYGESSKGGRRDLDDHIQAGHDACRVALEFRLGGQVYRVERTRHRTRNRTTLGLYRREGSEWVPIGEKAAADTQAQIERLLRLDYRTFTASAVLLQGQADVFTRGMTDTERKAALASILGLDIWDRIAERNSQAAATVEAEFRQVAARIEALREQAAEEESLRAERDRLAVARAGLDRRQAEIEAALGDLELAWEQQARAQADLQAVEQRLRELQRQVADREAQRATLRRQRQQLEQVLARRAEIEAAAREQADLQKALQETEAKAARYAQLLRRRQDLEQTVLRHQAEAERQTAALRATMEAARQQAAVMDRVPCRSTDLVGQCPLLAQARKAASQAAEAQAKLQALADAPPHPAEDELVDVLTALQEVDYDPEAAQALRRRLEAVAALAAQMSQLSAAEARAAALDERLAELDEADRRDGQEIETLRQRQQELTPVARKAQATQAAIASARAERTRIAQELRQVDQEIGRVEARLEQLAAVRSELADLEQRREELAEARTVHAILREACSPKGGVPALVVENAVPQIEAGANDLLQQISAGRMRVALETQRQTKAGTLSEALAVRVYVDGIERPYTFLSGAQQWLTDLALRISLSRLLQARAGAEVGLLVIDEGFGSLDAAGRARVREAIAALAMHFRKILIITHLADMQDVLPARIIVTRDGNGARAVVEP